MRSLGHHSKEQKKILKNSKLIPIGTQGKKKQKYGECPQIDEKYLQENVNNSNQFNDECLDSHLAAGGVRIQSTTRGSA